MGKDGVRLDETLVRHLRAEFRAGRMNAREMGKIYGMAAETIRRMLRGETWAWVTEGVEAPPEEVSSSLARLQAALAEKREEVGERNEELEALGKTLSSQFNEK